MLSLRNRTGFVEPYVLSSKWPCHVKPTTSSGLLQADPKTTTRPLFLESKPGFLPPNLPLCPNFLNNETVSHCHPKKTEHEMIFKVSQAIIACKGWTWRSCMCPVRRTKPSVRLQVSTMYMVEAIWADQGDLGKFRSFSKLNSFGRRWRELWKWQCYINGRIHLESIPVFF